MKVEIAAGIIVVLIIASLFATFALPRLLNFYGYGLRATSGAESISAYGINCISVNDTAGYVFISARNVSQINVSYYSTSFLINPVAPYIGKSGEALNVNVPNTYTSLPHYVDINITVPLWLDPQIRVDTAAANVKLYLNSSKDVYIYTAAGGVDVNVSYSSELILKTASGNINVHAFETSYIYAQTAAGNINADLTGNLLGKYIFQSSAGNLNVLIPSNSAVSFSVSSEARC